MASMLLKVSLLFLLSLLVLKSCGYEIPAIAGFSDILQAFLLLVASLITNDPSSVPTLVRVLSHVL